jgi:hypothetical protein
MRCPDCNKFVPFEDEEPDANDLTLEGDTLTGDLEVVQTCAECGTELRRASVSVEVEVEVDPATCVPAEDSWCAYCKVAAEQQEKCPGDGCEHDFSLTDHEWDLGGVDVALHVKKGTAHLTLSGEACCTRCALEVDVAGAAEGELEESV